MQLTDSFSKSWRNQKFINPIEQITNDISNN